MAIVVPVVVVGKGAVQGTLGTVFPSFFSPHHPFVPLFPTLLITVAALCVIVVFAIVFKARWTLCLGETFFGKTFFEMQVQFPSGESEPEGGPEPTPTLHGSAFSSPKGHHVEGSGLLQ